MGSFEESTSTVLPPVLAFVGDRGTGGRPPPSALSFFNIPFPYR
jgi:hypothetical protein